MPDSNLDVSNGKAAPLRVLVTGFGSFPGTRDNPTAALVRALLPLRARLARLGIELELHVLPVTYEGVARELEDLDETLKPGAILHFGLATRRRFFSVETRAMNRFNQLHCDVSGARAPCRVIVRGAPQVARATFPHGQITAALRRAGLHARLSANAGSYVCNETLYLSLARSHARTIGFIHVPRLARAGRPKRSMRRWRPRPQDLTRAALIAILVTARKLRTVLTQDCLQGLRATSF